MKMQKDSPLISVVSPVYGCSTSIHELYIRLRETLEKISPQFEIILVNDASPDDVWTHISAIARKDQRVKGINLSRNFGQHNAISAGLDYCTGEWVVVLDCDLQDQPEEILKLYEKASEGFDIVLGRRQIRYDNYFKKLRSRVFYFLLAYLTETQQDHTIGNFGIYNRKVIESIHRMKDHIRYFPALVRWVGYRSAAIEIDHAGRKHGETSYSFRKLANLALNTLLSFSDKPLRITVKFGLVISFGSLLIALYVFLLYISGEVSISGWTSLILSFWFLSGIIIFLLGLVGLYVGKTFEKVKDRPLYLIKETVN
jgi:dolichol-phosphate mannosyltransferase